jgi:hypothetical protein
MPMGKRSFARVAEMRLFKFQLKNGLSMFALTVIATNFTAGKISISFWDA